LFNRFQLAKKFLNYYLTASSGKGHGIHSPFVFDFIHNVLRDKKNYACYPVIETARSKLLKQKGLIDVEDPGAGSAVINTHKRAVADIAGSSLKPAKYARLLYRMVNYYRPKKILELGTSFGVTTAYLAAGNAGAKVFTVEGSATIADIAQKTFNRLAIENIELIRGDFYSVLPRLLEKAGVIDLAFIDGHHCKEPTLNYWKQVLAHSSSSTILIFDDIHWSTGMEEAWTEIKHHESVTLTIDLFFIGIVFINPDFKIRQHFTIRF